MLTLHQQEIAVQEYLRGLERRIELLESTFVQLLIALKEGGVIADSDDESAHKFDMEG